MIRESIKEHLENLKNRRYTTGVLHTATPQWLEDIRELIKIVEFLLDEKK